MPDFASRMIEAQVQRAAYDEGLERKQMAVEAAQAARRHQQIMEDSDALKRLNELEDDVQYRLSLTPEAERQHLGIANALATRLGVPQRTVLHPTVRIAIIKDINAYRTEALALGPTMDEQARLAYYNEKTNELRSLYGNHYDEFLLEYSDAAEANGKGKAATAVPKPTATGQLSAPSSAEAAPSTAPIPPVQPDGVGNAEEMMRSWLEPHMGHPYTPIVVTAEQAPYVGLPAGTKVDLKNEVTLGQWTKAQDAMQYNRDYVTFAQQFFPGKKPEELTASEVAQVQGAALKKNPRMMAEIAGYNQYGYFPGTGTVAGEALKTTQAKVAEEKVTQGWAEIKLRAATQEDVSARGWAHLHNETERLRMDIQRYSMAGRLSAKDISLIRDRAADNARNALIARNTYVTNSRSYMDKDRDKIIAALEDQLQQAVDASDDAQQLQVIAPSAIVGQPGFGAAAGLSPLFGEGGATWTPPSTPPGTIVQPGGATVRPTPAPTSPRPSPAPPTPKPASRAPAKAGGLPSELRNVDTADAGRWIRQYGPPEFVKQARAARVPEDRIGEYLQGAGVKQVEKFLAAGSPLRRYRRLVSRLVSEKKLAKGGTR